MRLEDCGGRCGDCGGRCVRNGGVGVDKPHLKRTDIHMYTDSPAYVNQDLECRVFGIGGQSVFIGVYLKDGGKFDTSTDEWEIEHVHTTYIHSLVCLHFIIIWHCI